MDDRSVRQILLARYYLHLAAEQLRQESEPAKFAAVILFQEAIEATLIACADHLNAEVSERSTIETYIDKINEKLAGENLPFRSRILQFNKARVTTKHHLTIPEDALLKSLFTIIPEFVKAAVSYAFKRDLDEINLTELVEDEPIRSHLNCAQTHFSNGRYYDRPVEARKAFYLQFEKRFDVSEFASPDSLNSKGIMSPFSLCQAPSFAKNPEYVRKWICATTDYIVLDHSRLDSENLKNGIDVHTFWNVWRLTPKVYQFRDGTWTNEYDPDLIHDENIASICTYVLDSIVAITLQMQSGRKRAKTRSGVNRIIRTIPNAQIFKKASKQSEEAGRLPDGVHFVNVDMAVPGLDGDGFYWKASYLRKGGPWIFGYISVKDTEGEPHPGLVADGL